jgi:mannitol-specific phosphotransferase system IIBC component
MQRIIGIALGALVTYGLLVVLVGTAGDASRSFGIAVLVGAAVSLLWPWLVGFYIGRRVKERRDEEIQRDVEKAIAADHKPDA